MKINKIIIHNFRSIKDATINIDDYGILVGTNNSGKSNVIDALRIFYEHDKYKFNDKNDFPKFNPDDNESWIEIHYKLSTEEYKNLKEDYRSPNQTLKVRKYLKSRSRTKPNQSNIYAYENDQLSDNLFYGAKNVSEGKLGSIIYIPEVQKIDDTMKMSGPSPLRNVLTFVMKRVVKTSESFVNLNKSFDNFNREFKDEASKDGFSINNFKEEINEELHSWEVEFGININSVKPEDIIKNLVSHHIFDKALNKEVSISNLGQGCQRHIIYTLLKLASKYVETKKPKKKEFLPEMNLILFEEPEAFLHPSQQEFLDSSLRTLSKEESQQVIITTHSPVFVSQNIEDITSLVKLRKHKAETKSFQIGNNDLEQIFSNNLSLLFHLKKIYDESGTSDKLKRELKKRFKCDQPIDHETKIQEESIRYILWLDSERSKVFFSDLTLICEGATEKAVLDYLIRNKWDDIQKNKIYVLDAMGKFSIHRYMSLFKELGIYHSILFDKDNDRDIHEIINQYIMDSKNSYTKQIDFFEKDIEEFLNLEPPSSSQLKPVSALKKLVNKEIPPEQLNKLKEKVLKGTSKNSLPGSMNYVVAVE